MINYNIDRAVFIVFVFLIVSCADGLIIKKIYSDNNVLVSELSMDKDSVLQGISITYFDNGKDIFEKANYINGELNGVREIYYPDGNLEIREQYKGDILIDTLYTFYKNGKTKTKAFYKNGTLTGVSLKYYKSGVLAERVTFQDDDENGPFEEYYENGQVSWTGTYLEGDNEVGELLQYNESGELIKKMICDELSKCKTVWTLEKGDIGTSNEVGQ